MTIVTAWGSNDPFLVNTTTDLTQAKGKVVALKDGTFLMVWEHTRPTSPGATTYETDIRGQIFNADGTKKGGEFVVIDRAGSQLDPKVAVLADGRVVVTWLDKSLSLDVNGDIRAQVLNADGTLSGSDFAVNTTATGIQDEPAIAALADGGFAISWTNEAGSAPDIGAQAFKAPVGTAAPEKVGAEVFVNTTTANAQKTSSIAGLSNGNYVVTYYDSSMSSEMAPVVRARILKPDGSQAAAEFVVPSSSGGKSLPSVTALADGRFVVTWQHLSAASGDNSGLSVKAQIFNADGTKSGGDFVINTLTDGDQKLPSIVAMPDGGFAVAYADYGSQPGLRVAIFNNKGLRGDEDYRFDMPLVEISEGAVLPPGKVSLNGTGPALAVLEDGRLVLSWSERGYRTEDDIGVYAIVLEPRDKGVTLGGNGFDNNFIGTKYADIINGQVGNDDLRGEDGDDILVGGTGADVLNGGNGRDTASYADAAASVTASLAVPASNAGDANGDTYISIENLIGSTSGDTLGGSDGDNVLDGLDGSDSLVGGRGADVLVGGDSATDTDNNDTLDGGVGADILVGGKGNDTYYVDDAADKITETVGAGQDVVIASTSYVLESGVEVEELRATGGSAVINLTGNEFINSLYGNGAGNELNGGVGADRMEGGGGDDIYYVDDQGDEVVEVADQGSDTVVISSDFASGTAYDLSAYVNVESLWALNGAGDISLIGNSGANRVIGNDGHNRLDGGNDTLVDTLVGGKGNDTYAIRHEGDVLVEVGGEGTDTASIATGNFTLSNNVSIEVLQADTSGGITEFALTGNNLANTIKGAGDNDILDGGGNATDAADRLEGGAGNDVYKVRHSGDVVVEALGDGTDDKIVAYASYTLGAGVFVETMEAVAGTAAIALTGNAEGNILTGNAGANVLEGRGGNDILDGGEGLNTAVFSGAKADYTITKNADGTVTIADKQADRDGSDLIRNVKYARFTDEIVDLQALPTLSIAAADAAKVEGSDGGWVDYTFTVTRSNTEGSPTANWTVTGIADDEIQTKAGTVTFVAGANTANITVKIKADTVIEDNEIFTVTLTDPTGSTIANSTATGTIINDDTPPALSIMADDAVKVEGNDSALTEFTFTVTRSHGIGPSTVTWTVSGNGTNPTSADDFDALSGTVAFANGETSKTIKVWVKVDTQFEQNEGFTVTLSNPTDAVIANATANGVILNDDLSASADTAPTDLRLTTGEAVASINENLAAGQTVARVMANDNASASELRYSIAENANFVIDALSGEIKVKYGAVLDYEGTNTYTVAVTVKDLNGAGQQTTENIAINLVDVNEAVTDIAFTGQQTVKVGATGANANVVLATAVDPDAPAAFNNNLYRFANGTTTDGLFTINVNTGQITTNRDVIGTDTGDHVLNVVAYDATTGGLSYTENYSVTVAAADPVVNTAPSNIRLTTGGTTAVVDENKSAGSVVATVTADDDGAASALRYSLTTADTNFEIDELTGQIKVKSGADLNYEGTNTFDLTVKVKDLNGGGLETTQTITINLADVNEAPILSATTTAVTISENADAGDELASFTLTDADAGENFVYEILNVPAAYVGAFAVNPVTKKIVVADPTKLPVSSSQNFTLTLKVTDKNGGAGSFSDTQDFIVTIQDVPPGNAAPTNLRLTTGEASVNENQTAGHTVARVTADDNGPASELRYSMASNANFVIDEITGEIKVKSGANLNYETATAHNVTVTVKDLNGVGQSATQTLTIDLNNLNEAATDIAFTGQQTVKVGATGANANVVLATAVDPDAPAAFNNSNNLYRFANGTTTDGLFTINVNTGQIVTSRVVTAEDVGDHTLNVVTYDASNMVLSNTKSHTVTVTAAANAAPSGLTLTTGGTVARADEHTKGGTVVAQVVAVDDGGAAGLRYSMTDSAFEIDAVTGQIKVKAGVVLDYEAKSTYTFEVTATDGEGLTATGDITINVADMLDIWMGTAGKDALVGTNGPDRFYGGYGNDVLTGGLGQDTFVFNAKLGTAKTDRKKNFDKIVGFNVTDDSVWLDDKIFKAKDLKKLGKGASEANPKQLNKKFFSLDKAKDADDYFIYNKKTGVLSYDADGSGSKQGIEIAKFDKKLKMTYKDFFIV